MREIKSLGLRGVKIHPAYQEVYMDDIRYLRILEAAAEQDLVVVVHAGVDIGVPSVWGLIPEHFDRLPMLARAILSGNVCV